ncbi:hypothetical protein [Cryobacterium sp. MLB-32]|nr:hypothetical protein [Cryobacterium sp. MLB-32]
MALQFTSAPKNIDGFTVILCGGSWRDMVADTTLRSKIDHLPSCA